MARLVNRRELIKLAFSGIVLPLPTSFPLINFGSSNLTDKFDVVIQLSEELINRILLAEHRAQAIRHQYTSVYQGKAVDMVLNALQVKLRPTSAGDVESWFDIHDRIYFNSRPLRDPSNAGFGAVVEIDASASISLGSTSVEINSTKGASVLADFRKINAENLNVHSLPQQVTEVKDAVLQIISRRKWGTFRVPPIGEGDRLVRRAAFRFAESMAKRAVIVGMSFSSTSDADRDNLKELVVDRDWALVISRNHILMRLRQNFPGLPLTLGRRCTIRNPLTGRCLNTATARLVSFDLNLEEGSISIKGKIKIRNSGAVVPDSSISFTARIGLTISAQFDIGINIQAINVSTDWFLSLVNFFSSSAIIEGIRTAIEGFLRSNSGELGGFFSSKLIQQVGDLGRQVNVVSSLLPTIIRIRRDGIIVSGDVILKEDDLPEAGFSVSSADVSSGEFVFNAVQSWAPGGTIVKYKWNFGDGTEAITEGNNARIVITHSFQTQIGGTIEDLARRGSTPSPAGPGVCLTVYDQKGRSKSTCGGTMLPPLLIEVAVVLNDPLHSSITTVGGFKIVTYKENALRIGIQVLHNGKPAEKTIVSLQGLDQTMENVSDSKGKASFVLSDTFNGVPAESFIEDPSSPKLKDCKAILILARKSGFQVAETILFLQKKKP